MLTGVNLVSALRKPDGLDIADSFAGYSQNLGLFPVSDSSLPKARQWCRALQRQIKATWWATVETDTHPLPGGRMHGEAEAVMVEAALTVASIQVLYEIFLGSYPRTVKGDMSSSVFEVHSHTVSEGRVVSGLKPIRNGEMHANTIVVPTINRAVGVPFDDGTHGFRIFPHWAKYGALPVEVREARHEPKKGKTQGKLKTNQVHHDHYKQVVGGGLVIDTFLDALKFFTKCDPRIVRIKADGEPQHFPLTPIVERDYERRHPEWPSRSKIEADLRALCESNPPSCQRRTIVHRLRGTGGEVLAYCGYTKLTNGQSHIFTETPNQVKRDIAEFGTPYWVEESGMAHRLVLAEHGELEPVNESSEPSDVHPSNEELPWRAWFETSQKDAFEYKRQRKLHQ